MAAPTEKHQEDSSESGPPYKEVLDKLPRGDIEDSTTDDHPSTNDLQWSVLYRHTKQELPEDSKHQK